MRKVLGLSLISLAVLAMSCAPKATQTIENLKAAATGETNASAHYALFSERAMQEGYPRVANMLAATSAAEAIHAGKHLQELAALGVTDFVPVVEEIELGTTIDNLVAANEGEVYEFTTMYPGFIEVAVTEKAKGAQEGFEWANSAEKKHSIFYTAASTALADSTAGDAMVAGVWVICPKCGDTYMQSELGHSCELCGTAADKFKVFNS